MRGWEIDFNTVSFPALQSRSIWEERWLPCAKIFGPTVTCQSACSSAPTSTASGLFTEDADRAPTGKIVKVVAFTTGGGEPRDRVGLVCEVCGAGISYRPS